MDLTKKEKIYLFVCNEGVESKSVKLETSGQSYKHFTLVNYDSTVVPDWKIPHIMTLELQITIVNCL